VPERYLGRTLGKYRVDALIGSGGFAWVYKAFDPELEIPVALKVLKPHYAGDEKIEQRFRREASTAARLRHPNVVKIFAVGSEEGAVYFAMDYLPTGLADRLEVMSVLPESLLLRMGIDVASALGYAHREGVIHRDIKVDNILFDDHGNAVVADFGIARAVTGYVGQTSTGMVVGTPQYFSPEQARALPLDGRADIYSLGVTLFRAATGRLPFEGDDWYDIARQHVEDRPPRPRNLNSSLSKDAERIILKCMAKSPDDRYASGEQLAEELTTALEGLGESTTMKRASLPPAITTASPAWLPMTRAERRRVLPLAVGALVLVGGGLAFAIARGGDEDRPAPASGAAGGSVGPTVSGTDSVPGTTIGRADPTGRPAPARRESLLVRRPSLVVRAPDNASLSVDGRRVSTGPWRSDSLAPGRHRIRAVVPAVEGCPTAEASETISLSAGSRVVTLNPRGCGQLKLDAKPAGATYTVRSGRWSDGPRAVPEGQVIVVPFGDVQVTVEAPRCAPYSGTHQVGPRNVEDARYVRAHLVCGAG
jgi:eukaryotic-like serine/threonine-protein kinase